MNAYSSNERGPPENVSSEGGRFLTARPAFAGPKALPARPRAARPPTDLAVLPTAPVQRRPVHIARRILRALLICCLSFAGLSARGQVAQEYDLKAAFLCKFALFVKWPTNAFPDAKAPITIGVLGSDPFGKSLDEVARNEIVQSRKLVVESFGSVESLIGPADGTNKICHLLFVSQSESGKLGKILAGLKGRPILTVGESDRFCQNGGIIQFVIVENKVRFIINQDAARAANIKLSATLLDLAEKNRKR